MKTSILENPPYDRPVVTLVSNIQLARLGRQLARKQELLVKISAINLQIKTILEGRSARRQK